jgi:DNA-binding MarR family transcriptional regulator
MPVHIHHALVLAAKAQKNATRPSLYEIGLSPGQPKVLTFLSKHDSCMQKDIAEACDIEPATISQILSKMEQAGLIRRTNFAERKRADSVSITEKGRKAFDEWMQICTKVDRISLQGFSEQEQQQFYDYLCRMYHNLTGKSVT